MSTVVYQGLQSCLESQLLETQMLRLRLASTRSRSFLESIARGAPFVVPENEPRDKSHFKEIAHNHISSNPDHSGGWSFLLALSNTSQSPKDGLLDKELSSYSHPMAKKSSSTLSNKSLELCTENLGSETGTDISESSIFSLSSLDMQGGETPAREEPPKSSSRQQMESKRVINKSRDFPPPLTSISSCSSVQIRPHREGGRLIISAVEAPLRHTYLQAERSHGRLRLSFWKDCSSSTATDTFDSEMATEEDEDSDFSLSSTSSSSAAAAAASSSFASFSSSSA